MSGRPYDQEEYFDGVPPEQISETYLDLLEVPAFRELSPDQIEIIERILFDLEFLATLAQRELDKCKWSADELRANSIPASITRVADIRAWNRFRANRQCLDACQHTRSAIFHGNWIIAISLALVAGNKSQEDLAAIGTARRKNLTAAGSTTPLSEPLMNRNRAILKEAAEIRAKNRGYLSDNAIADIIEHRHKRQQRFPKARTIRGILADEKKLATRDLPCQK